MGSPGVEMVSAPLDQATVNVRLSHGHRRRVFSVYIIFYYCLYVKTLFVLMHFAVQNSSPLHIRAQSLAGC
jgi:hypothetical protein